MCLQSPAVKNIFPGVHCYGYNCIAETGSAVYIGLCDGRIACFTTRVLIMFSKVIM